MEKPRRFLGIGIGVLALAMMQGQVKAQFAWHGPQTITTGVINIPSLVQATPGTYGAMGNYELVVPLRSGGIGHFFRNNDDPNLPWSEPVAFATDQGAVNAVSLIQSNFSSSASAGLGQGPGNLAVVATVGNNLLYYFREDVGFTWSGATTIATGVYGVPSFIQAKPGTYGTMGNFELVTPLQSGGIAHYFRDNDNPSLPWAQTAVFGTELGIVDAVAIVQSSFSTAAQQGLGTFPSSAAPGNLAVISRTGNQLDYWFRDDVSPFAWHGPTTITTGVTGNPSFVQAIPGTYGTVGNYELAVPLRSGGIGHFFRNNDDPNLPWSGPTATFGTSLGAVDGVSLIQSSFSSAAQAGLGTFPSAAAPGNLAVVSVTGNELDYFFRDDF
jgi:uncharacterized membrane protein